MPAQNLSLMLVPFVCGYDRAIKCVKNIKRSNEKEKTFK
jgi:hypothetical protein